MTKSATVGLILGEKDSWFVARPTMRIVLRFVLLLYFLFTSNFQYEFFLHVVEVEPLCMQ